MPSALAARALTPGDRGHARYTAGYFRGGDPGLVLRPRTPAEVQDAVRYAAGRRDVPLGLFSGGHGLSGRSLNDGGIVIALDALDDVTVLDGHRVRIGPGARWGDVARKLARTASRSPPAITVASAWAGWRPRAASAGSSVNTA